MGRPLLLWRGGGPRERCTARMPISNRHARGLPAESCAMTLCTVVTPERRDPFRVPSRSQGARVVTVTSPAPPPPPAGPRVGPTPPPLTLPHTAGRDVP